MNFKKDYIEHLKPEARLKMSSLMDTLNNAERTRHSLYGEYKESYIHDIQFLLNFIEELQEQLEDYKLSLQLSRKESLESYD